MSIDVVNVSKKFGGFHAVDDVTVSFGRGMLTALLGPSGGGKSTLLRIIAGLEEPDTGRVYVDGKDMTRVPARRRGVGFVFQHYAAFPHMTVRDNVGFGLRVARVDRATRAQRVDELLDLVHLQGLAHRYPAELSGGQRQRMALARALALEPRLLLLDEPFGALDVKVRAELRAWLRQLHEQVNATTLFVTHDQEEAMELADQIVLINQGRVEQIGTPEDLYDRPANEFVMAFLGATTRLGGVAVRPHDIEVFTDPVDGGIQAMIERVIGLGFHSRVEAALPDGSDVTVQLTRAHAHELGLRTGDIVYLRAIAGAASHATDAG
ncbi:MAG: TOBE-like domain-containing protein [Frankiaceae bacterium]|nr:TOBE-like domain-containing protein [Frankiaceae bacterium]